MAKTFTPIDAAAILAAAVREQTGQETTLQSVNINNFASIGESLQTTGQENVLNKLSTVIFREMIAVRPYTGSFLSIRSENNTLFQQRLRKISYKAKDPKNAGNFNTNLFTNLKTGFTNGRNLDSNGVPQSTGSMWEQDLCLPYQVFFGGSQVWQGSYEVSEDALKDAFRSPDNLAKFVDGYITSKMNDIESQKEAFSRLTFLQLLAGTIDQASVMPGSVINMTAAYNAHFGTSKSTNDLLTTDLTSFLEFFTATVKKTIRKFENRSALFHDPRTETIDGIDYSILRHTPKDRQRLVMLADFWDLAEAMVKPAIFSPEYLDIGKQIELVDFWQNEANPWAIDVVPSVFDQVNGVQIQGSQVQESVVLGALFDEEAIWTSFQLDSAYSTPLEARKHFRNVWFSMAQQGFVDPTEKTAVFIMNDN